MVKATLNKAKLKSSIEDSIKMIKSVAMGK